MANNKPWLWVLCGLLAVAQSSPVVFTLDARPNDPEPALWGTLVGDGHQEASAIPAEAGEGHAYAATSPRLRGLSLPNATMGLEEGDGLPGGLWGRVDAVGDVGAGAGTTSSKGGDDWGRRAPRVALHPLLDPEQLCLPGDDHHDELDMVASGVQAAYRVARSLGWNGTLTSLLEAVVGGSAGLSTEPWAFPWHPCGDVGLQAPWLQHAVEGVFGSGACDPVMVSIPAWVPGVGWAPPALASALMSATGLTAQAQPTASSLTDLLHLVASGKPVATLVYLGHTRIPGDLVCFAAGNCLPGTFPTWRYLLVTGVDLDAGLVLVMDAASNTPFTLPVHVFEASWSFSADSCQGLRAAAGGALDITVDDCPGWPYAHHGFQVYATHVQQLSQVLPRSMVWFEEAVPLSLPRASHRALGAEDPDATSGDGETLPEAAVSAAAAVGGGVAPTGTVSYTTSSTCSVSLPDSKVIRIQFELTWNLPVNLAVYYMDLCGVWSTAGYFSVKPGKVVTVAKTTSNMWYFFATESTTGLTWSGKGFSGSVTKLLGDRPLLFRKVLVPPVLGTAFITRLNAPDYPVYAKYRITLQNKCTVEPAGRFAFRFLNPVSKQWVLVGWLDLKVNAYAQNMGETLERKWYLVGWTTPSRKYSWTGTSKNPLPSGGFGYYQILTMAPGYREEVYRLTCACAAVNCRWGAWSSWSACIKRSNGQYQKMRTRAVVTAANSCGAACVGPAFETAACTP